MEIKNSADTVTENTNTRINATSTFKSFPWTAFQQSLKRINIISAINQLLSIYYPSDGVVAYKHLIKTLLILCKHLDSGTQQQIISVVPFPKNMSNDRIRNLIYKTTELVISTNNMSTYQKITAVPVDKFNMEVLKENSVINSKKNIFLATSQSFKLNEKCISAVPKVFKGFSPNEISTIHNDLSIDKAHNWKQCNMTSVPCTTHQGTSYLNRKLCRNNIITHGQNKNDALNLELMHNNVPLNLGSNHKILNNNINKSFKKNDNNGNQSKNINNELQEYFGSELKHEQYALQQDIYNMDVVCSNEEKGGATDAQILDEESDFVTENYVIHKNLKRSLQNLLKRAEENVQIEFPILPITNKPLHEISSTSKYWKLADQEDLKNNNQLDAFKDDMIAYKNINTPGSIKQFIEKKLPVSKSSKLQVLHKNLSAAVNKPQTVEREKKNTTGNLPYKFSTMKQPKQQNSKASQQITSITEFTTYKKQYYDTVLNIPKAKMAVANSLAILPVQSSPKYDSCSSNHSHQQEQLLQQHGALTINPQYAIHSVAQSGLSNMHNTAYTWTRCNNFKHTFMKQLRSPQQFPFHVSRNKE